jgi:hypothetical protein
VVGEEERQLVARVLDGDGGLGAEVHLQEENVGAEAGAQTLAAYARGRRVEEGGGGHPVVRAADVEVAGQARGRADQAGNATPDVGVRPDQPRQDAGGVVGERDVVAEEEEGSAEQPGVGPFAGG